MSRVPAILLLAISCFVTAPLHAQRAPAWRPGEVLVYLAKDASIQAVQEHLTRTLPNGTSVAKEVQLGDGSRYHRIVFQGGGLADAELLERAAQAPGVERSSLNYLVEHFLAPNDPQYAAQWHMQSINVEPVWNVTTGGAMANGMRIAVGINDSEVQANHPDLAGNMLIGQPGAGDVHGTAVAGVVGAVGNNNLGVSGVNWDVDLVSFANANDLSDVTLQFQQCLNQRTAFNTSGGANGAMIVAITVSWGAAGVNCGFGDPLFDDLGAQGVLVITSGPNDPTDIDVVDSYPATCPNANNIVVTSIGPLGQIPFAVGDNTVHLLAPGMDIVSTTLGGGTITADGNSFAIPHVAGAVALLYSNDCPQFAAAALIDPQGTAMAVKDAILNSVTPVAGAGALTITGGKLNVSAAFNLLNAGCTGFCQQVDVSITGTLVPNMTVFVVNADGQTVAQQQASNFSTCLPTGCYFVALLDQDGLPTDGTVTVTDANGDTLVSSATTNGSLSFSSGAVVFGCTNPNSANFNPAADCDDGSCCTALATITLSDSGADGWEGATYTLANSLGTFSLSGTLASGASSDTTLCLPDGCYTMTVTAGTDSAEVAWSITGVGINPVSDGAGTTTSLSAGNVVFGCTDPNGCNYDPQANCSAGCSAGSLISVIVFGNDFPEEMGWTLFEPDGDVLLSGGADVQLTTCAAPGCDYVMEMTDSFGDGWNGGGYIISTTFGDIDGSLFFGALGADTIVINAISGCTDTLANNFNALAVCEDGSCCYGPGEISLSITVDAFSLPVTWALEGSTGDTLASGGNVFDMKACAAPGCDQLITMTAPNASGWQGGAYTITAADGSWTTTGTLEIGTSGSDPIAVGNTFGCLDPLANNFDPAATCDNGTCCYGADIPVVIFSQPPGPDSTWVLLNAADSLLYTSNGAFQQQTCVEPACQLTLIIEDPAGDGSPSFVDMNAVDFSFSANAFADEGDSTATTFTFGLVQGCTDTLANNYDPSASCDNGTCCYGTTSLVIFSAPSLVIGWQVVDTAGTVVAQATAAPTQNACVEPSCSLVVTVTDTVADGFEESLFIYDQATNVQSTYTPVDGGTLTEPIILGGTTGCTDTAAVNFDPNALCDDGSCCFGTVATLFLQSDDFFSEGSADVTITQGATTVFSGQLPIEFDDNIGISYGQFGFCAANGCLSISVSEFDVPLFFQSFLSLDNDPNNPIEFNTLQGLQTGIGGTLGTEVCDGFDNDCNGLVDEGFTWYTDADGDGYGDEATGVFNCAPQPGLINIGGDCNDTNAAVNPGATEVCDGQDTNCDGITDLVLTGCTDPMACNYDPSAICDDGSCVQGSNSTGSETYSPDWTAVATTGDTVNLYSLLAQGKTVVLDLFAAWCPPSQAMLNANFLQDWNAHMGPAGTDDIRIVAIAVDQSAGNLAPFIASAQWPVIVTDGESFGPLYAVLGMYNNAVPTLLMICPDRSVTMLYPQPDDLPYTGLFNYDPAAALELLNDKCGCRGLPCNTNIGCMDTTSCNYDPLATCPGACIPASEWFIDNDGDGYGTTSVGSSCTPIAGAATVSGDCDDSDPLAFTGFTLYVLTEDVNDAGTAHYVITQGTTVIEGDLDLPAATQGLGELSVCMANGCFTISITQNDVPLWPEAYVLYPGEESEAIPFNILDSFSDALGGAQAEVCDGVDNDCDGSVDEGVAPLWYPDLDSDGYGDQDAGVAACTPIPGSITTGGDCDDTNANVHPDALDPCATPDGLDNDCNGLVDDLSAPVLLCPADVTVTASGPGCEALVTYDEPSPCFPGTVLLVSGPASGSTLPEGTTTVTYGVFADEPAQTLFSEDFSDNSAGWLLDTEWEIGSTFGSVGCECGEDPTFDHTATADNGVAGMALGIGLAPCVDNTVHPFRYLTSPVIDASAVVGPLVLEFWRNLHGDYLPYMEHHIQVFDGTNWITVWESTETVQCLSDLDWTLQQIVVTPYKNAAFRMRFGQAVTDPDAFSTGGWNVDDIALRGSTTPDVTCSFTVTVVGTAWYADADGDGFGDALSVTNSCTQPTGTVANSADCNDASAAISPLAGELCDGIDNDCDGSIDEGTTPVLLCPPALTVTAEPLACAAAVIFPGATFDACSSGSILQTTGPLSGAIFPIGTTTIGFSAFVNGGSSNTLLAEDFNDNGAGWTLDPEWQIGPAIQGSGASTCPGNDPSTDHTSTADNGLAGMIIGGNVSSFPLHPFFHLTSPIIDASAVPGNLTLEYWRHLHGDYAPYMQHQVQVFDGTNWVTVWQHTVAQCLNDPDWTLETIDITAYKNANLQVRFGQAVGANGAFTSGGWSLDDVRVFTGTGFDATCSSTITVLPSTQPGPFTCGPTLLQPTSPGQCTAALSAVPMTAVFLGCALDSIGVTGPALLPPGTTTVLFTGYLSGLSVGTCAQVVNVVDDQAPIITCAAPLLITANAGSCTATNVVLTAPTATDNCSVSTVVSDHPGTSYNAGTTVVTWTATDAAGNTATCAQNVTVLGNNGTTLIGCPSNVTLAADPFSCEASFTYTPPVAEVNCSILPLSLISGLPSGAAFPPGTTTVNYELGGTVFAEDFSDNSAGWTLGTEWAIGPATTSACATPSVGNDPGTDHSPTADNGVAGMAIGGCVSTALHSFHYLISPSVDVTGVPGTLTFSFLRHLHSDHIPFMENVVQVFDGTTWVTVWTHTAQVVINDPDWTTQSFDVTAYKNANFQMRFGQRVNSAGAFQSGGWNIDDVALSGAATGVTCSFTVTVTLPVWYADTDGDGLGDPATSMSDCTPPAGFVADNTDNCPMLAGVIGDPCDDGDPGTSNDVISATCTCFGDGSIRLAMKALLDGPYNTTTGRMRDDLRVLGLVPTTQPFGTPPFSYTGVETVLPVLLANADPDNAIVDWVLLELRDATTPTMVLHRRAALVQRDGDVVDTDGSSPVSFTASGGMYHVVIRHRNHFGVMTAAPLPLSATPTVIDLTAASTPTFGTEARKGLPTGTMLLWGCNARPDALMRYTGVTNDRDPMLIAVGGSVPTAILPNVYRSEDVNLDGTVKYTNVNNDRDPLLINVNWGFGTTSVTRQRFEQLP